MTQKEKWETFKVGYAPTWFKVKSDWKILDVGSGHNPHPRANVLLDRYPEENTERSGDSMNTADSRLVIGDVQKMPFQDGEFDFIIASHIAEHVEDPKSFCEELMRVGKAGVIESPGKVGEFFLSEPFHEWYVYVKNGVLTFQKIKKQNRLGILGKLFYAMFYSNDDRYQKWTFKSVNPFVAKVLWKVKKVLSRFWRSRYFRNYAYTSFSWKDRFEYKIID